MPYDTRPETFNDLYASVLGQVAATAERGPLPAHECVTLTAGAFCEMVEIIGDLRARVALLENKIASR